MNDTDWCSRECLVPPRILHEAVYEILIAFMSLTYLYIRDCKTELDMRICSGMKNVKWECGINPLASCFLDQDHRPEIPAISGEVGGPRGKMFLPPHPREAPDL